jgi:NAD dependent epimerase/dehydratase family enzyme
VHTTKRILISGSHGLVGSALINLLTAERHEIVRLVRQARAAATDIEWHPEKGVIDRERLEEGFDAVVHLAGENIAAGRWTDAKKRAILESRVKGTALLSETLASLRNPPPVFVSASAIGYYGDRGDEQLTEQSAPGTGFLAGRLP